jgi:hypothetical protein
MAYKLTLKKKSTRPSTLTVTTKRTAQSYAKAWRTLSSM